MNNYKMLNMSDFVDDLVNGLNELNDILYDLKDKIIKRKIRIKGKVKYLYLISHNILLDEFPLFYYYFGLKKLHRLLNSK